MCGVDIYGGDLDNQWSETLQDCAGACAANEQCVAASFVGGKGTGRCYLKSTKNGANMNDSVDGMLYTESRCTFTEKHSFPRCRCSYHPVYPLYYHYRYSHGDSYFDCSCIVWRISKWR